MAAEKSMSTSPKEDAGEKTHWFKFKIEASWESNENL